MQHLNKSCASNAHSLIQPASLPAGFIPLDQESRTHVSTAVMCHHIGRKEQTARGWACHEDGPLRPIRVNGRLAWPVADIRRILGVVSKVEA
jgi:hypothetical protein